MSDMTIKEATRAIAKAERDISEILTRLVSETWAIDISTNLRCVRNETIGDSDSRLYVERFEIRLEI